MKEPRQPKNYHYWLSVLQDSNKVKAFMDRGTEQQRKDLQQAQKYQKWEQIQVRAYA